MNGKITAISGWRLEPTIMKDMLSAGMPGERGSAEGLSALAGRTRATHAFRGEETLQLPKETSPSFGGEHTIYPTAADTCDKKFASRSERYLPD